MRLTAAMRKEFVANIIKDIPRVDYRQLSHELVKNDAASKLPEAIRKIYDDRNLRVYLASDSFYLAHFGYIKVVAPVGYEISTKLSDELNELGTKHQEQEMSRAEVKLSLTAIANACTTVEALRNKLPEFEKYIPKPPEKPNKDLPMITTLVADLTKLGWPASAQLA